MTKKGPREVEGERKPGVSEKFIGDECSDQASSDITACDGSQRKSVSDDILNLKTTNEVQSSNGGNTIICGVERRDIGRYRSSGGITAEGQKDSGESSASRRTFDRPRYEQDRDKEQRRYYGRDGGKGYGRHTPDEGRQAKDSGQRRFVNGSRDHRRDLRSEGGRSRGYPQRNVQGSRDQRSRSGVHPDNEERGYCRNANSAYLKHQSVQRQGEDEPTTSQQEYTGQRSRGSTRPPVNRSGCGRKAESAKDRSVRRQRRHEPAAALKHPEPSTDVNLRIAHQSTRTRQDTNYEESPQTHRTEK